MSTDALIWVLAVLSPIVLVMLIGACLSMLD